MHTGSGCHLIDTRYAVAILYQILFTQFIKPVSISLFKKGGDQIRLLNTAADTDKLA